MPLFDWDADDRSVVNPRIWVFFLFAVPLTAVTIGIWRLWLNYRTKRQVQPVNLSIASLEYGVLRTSTTERGSVMPEA